MSPKMLPSARRGVTLIELMIALFLFVMVFGLAVPFFRFQAKSVSQSSGRQDALQNARFAQNTIDRDLRIAGIGVVSSQPLLVQADQYAITFNADLTTGDSSDASSIYYDPAVDSTGTISMTTALKQQLAYSAWSYPDSNYFANSIPSRAETIQYWVSVDSTAGRPDQYVLFRRVNALPAKVVAKGLIIPTGQAFFTYFRPDSTGHLDSVPTASLPLLHSAPIHGSNADTGKSSWTDSIRVVRIVAWGLYKDPQKGDIIRKVESSSKLINSGMVRATMCGDVPLPATGVTATALPVGGPYTKVNVQWNASIDQDNGEKDVERYMVFKKKSTDVEWGEPIADVAASGATFSLDDTDLTTGGFTWSWSVVAQDCSPANSSLALSGAITLP
jgi:prepilin-type N-terminal cleavage/methylation domain-containing protein